MPKLSLILLGAVASTGIVIPADAKETEGRSLSVSYDDLNLQTAAGRERLDTRVRFAIKTVCAADPRPTLAQRAAESECQAAAQRSVEPQLAALFNGSSARFASEKPPVVAAP